MPTRVREHVNELQDAIQVASLNFDVWWVYKSKDSRPEIVEVLNKYNLFFQTSISAHFSALLVTLYRIYETRQDTFNIPDLLTILKKDSLLDNQAASDLDSIYREAKPIWLKVNILRNKVFGHRTKKRTIKEAFAEASVSPDELKKLVSLTKKFLNKATHELYDAQHAFNLDATESTKRLLSDLKSLGDRNNG